MESGCVYLPLAPGYQARPCCAVCARKEREREREKRDSLEIEDVSASSKEKGPLPVGERYSGSFLQRLDPSTAIVPLLAMFMLCAIGVYPMTSNMERSGFETVTAIFLQMPSRLSHEYFGRKHRHSTLKVSSPSNYAGLAPARMCGSTCCVGSFTS